MFKKKNIIILIFLFLLAILAILLYFLFGRMYCKYIFEKDVLSFASKNEKTIFSIDKCVFFSNCDAKNKTSSSTNFTIENLYQYTDIALFINNNSEENTLENTLKKVKIANLNYDKQPEVGNYKLYYKNLNTFAQSTILNNNAFETELDFNISSNDTTDLNTPTLYNNCANPIVLSYVNDNIKTDYAITDNSNSITYDGSLLKKCYVPLNSLNTKFSFDIFITNNLEQEFKCTVYINNLLEDEDKSLYNGAITLTKNTNYKFYRYK